MPDRVGWEAGGFFWRVLEAFFCEYFSFLVLERIFLRFWKNLGGPNRCQNQFLMCFLRCLFGGDLGVDFFMFLKFFFQARTLIFVRTAGVL